MAKSRIPLAGRIAIAMIALIALALLVYNLPPVHDRLAWRLDFAAAYVRGVIHPVDALPTPRVVQAAVGGPGAAVGNPGAAVGDPGAAVGDSGAAAVGGEGATPTATHPPVDSTVRVTRATATPARPTVTPTRTLTPTAIPASVQLPAPAYELQEINNCGPATLAMYLRFYGWDGNQKDISDLIKPIPGDRNVNVEELASYTWSRVGWLNFIYRVGGDTDLLREFIAAGIPVMIEETFIMAESYWPNDDRWAGHYLLVTGYDDALKVFTAQDSFVAPNVRVSYTDLDRNWQSFNRVYMLLYRPDQEETVKSILGDDWDQDTNRQNALEKAKAETESDPENAFAWFNLGSNYVYFDRNNEAVNAYDQARRIGLPQRMLRYQFGPFLSYFHGLRTDELMALTEYALQITPNSEEALLWRGWGMYRLGNTNEAVSLFNEALAARPGYEDALYALNFVYSN